ncbi:MAG: hypothetical protein QM749_08855 [Aquabacterium sp.]
MNQHNTPMHKARYGALAVFVACMSVVGVQAATGSKADYDAAKATAKQARDVAEAQCKALSGNAKDVCKAKAKVDYVTAESNAEAKYKGTEKAVYNARVDVAKAKYDLAKEECDDKTGNDKSVCRKDAEAAYVAAKADAKASRKTHEAADDAADAKTDAAYDAEKQRCDALSGDAKDACVAKVKATYGR